MALIMCPECGKEVSDKAKTCPNCGVEINNQEHQSNFYQVNPKKKRGCLFSVIAFLVFCFVVAIIATQTSNFSGENPPTGTGTNTSSMQDAGETQAALLELGKTVTLEDWEITALSYEVTDSIKSSEYTSFNADPGSKFVVITMTVKNIGTTAGTFVDYISISGESIICKVYYQDKYEYSSTNLLGHKDDIHYTFVNPLESKTGIIAYSVIDEAAQSDELTFSISIGRESYVYYLYPTNLTTSKIPETSNIEIAAVSSSATPSEPEVSPSPNAVIVPNVVNMLSHDAISILESIGLNYQITYKYCGGTVLSPDYIPPGEVVEQSIASGTEASIGVTVDLVVSQGPESAAKPDNPDAQ